MKKIAITAEEALEMLKDAATGYIEVIGIEKIPRFEKGHETRKLELMVNG
jgi:predicted RNase H-like HicB family nuclease